MSCRIGIVICMAICGCGRSTVPNIQTLPVKGTITLDDKPLVGANVVFMTFEPPAAFIGTTKEDGTYQLQGPEGRAANLKGSCKVTVSRMVKPDGSLLAPGELPAMVQAVEQLPAKYSRLEATTLAQTVAPEGGTYDFKLTSR